MLLSKEPKELCFSADENLLHSQYNALRHLIYHKQSYCKDVQIYTTFRTHER